MGTEEMTYVHDYDCATGTDDSARKKMPQGAWLEGKEGGARVKAHPQ